MNRFRVLIPIVALPFLNSCDIDPKSHTEKLPDNRQETGGKATRVSDLGRERNGSIAISVEPEDVVQSVAKVDWTTLRVMEREGAPPPEWRVLVRSEWELVTAGKRGIPTLFHALSDESPEVRRLAAVVLGRIGDYSAVQPLSNALSSEEEFPVRVSIVESLGLIGGEEAKKSLAGILALTGAPGGFWDVKREVEESLRYAGTVDRKRILEEYNRADPTLINAAAVGKTIPDMVVLDSSGRGVRLADLSSRGNLVLVFVFAEFCMYCNGQIRSFLGRVTEISNAGGYLAFVVPQVPERVEAWKMDISPQLTFLSDPAGRLQALFGVAKQIHLHERWFPSPSCAIVDRKGVLRFLRQGKAYNDRISPQQVLTELGRLQ